MGALQIAHRLAWVVKLCAGGYTCHELLDEGGRRWGWVINASQLRWDAHLGDFGQAADLGLAPPPVDSAIGSFPGIETAKAWVEEGVAKAWHRQERS